MAQSPLCLRCNEFNESVCHACLFECQQSNAMWLAHPSVDIITAAPRGSFAVCFAWLCENSDPEALAIICASLWACWYGRNRIVMENKQCDFLQVSTSFVKLVNDYNIYAQNVVEGSSPTQAVSRSWQAPTVGWIKANFDAYIGADFNRGLGVVFRNHEGTLLVAAVWKLKSNMGVEESELSAACFALEVAVKMGYDHVIWEGDAQCVINSIKKEAAGVAPIFAVYDYLHVLSSLFFGFSCNAVRRSGNTVAHMVARWDTGIAHEKICMEPFPSGVRALVTLDLL